MKAPDPERDEVLERLGTIERKLETLAQVSDVWLLRDEVSRLDRTVRSLGTAYERAA